MITMESWTEDWTPQGRIPDKFTVLEEPKEEQRLTFSDFLFNQIIPYYNEWVLFICHEKNLLNIKTLN